MYIETGPGFGIWPIKVGRNNVYSVPLGVAVRSYENPTESAKYLFMLLEIPRIVQDPHNHT